MVRVIPDILPRVRALRYARIEDISPPDEDGWVTLSVRFETEEEACEYVLGFGPQIEVLEPPELREKVICLAESVVASYTKTAHSFDEPKRS